MPSNDDPHARRRPPHAERPSPVAADGYGDTDHDDQESLPMDLPTVPPPPATER